MQIQGTITKPKTGLWGQKFYQCLFKTGLWGQKFYQCLFCLANISLAIGYITLLFYCLVWKAGNIVNVPSKTIGFYNFCLLDQETEMLKCFKDLEKLEINNIALILSRVCVYFTPVLCLFAAFTIIKALCLKDMELWNLACGFLALSSFLLPVGLSLFLFYTKQWMKVSESGEVFVGLIGAHVLMLLHLVVIVLHTARVQCKEPFLRKGVISYQENPVNKYSYLHSICNSKQQNVFSCPA